MPVSVKRSPSFPARRGEEGLRNPQALVLQALMPKYPEDHPREWPTLTRARLGVLAGYTVLSGTVTRAMDGLRRTSKSGPAHPGLIARGLIKAVRVELDGGIVEVSYRITPEGIRQLQAHLKEHVDRPPVKSKVGCTNNRYLFAAFLRENPASTLTIEQWVALGKPKS